HFLHAGAAHDEHLILPAGLLHGLDYAQGDVIILGPHCVDLGEAGQEVLHDLEAIVPVPVGILPVEDVDFGSFDHFHEGIEPLVVNDGGNTPQDDDITLAAQGFHNVLSGYTAHAGVVAGHIDILDARPGQAPVHHGNEHSLLLEHINGIGQGVRLEG